MTQGSYYIMELVNALKSYLGRNKRDEKAQQREPELSTELLQTHPTNTWRRDYIHGDSHSPLQKERNMNNGRFCFTVSRIVRNCPHRKTVCDHVLFQILLSLLSCYLKCTYHPSTLQYQCCCLTPTTLVVRLREKRLTSWGNFAAAGFCRSI